MSEPINRGIVALGGGHGLYATLSAARRLTPYVTAVVTVADDGGSSGRLRSELGVVPPGDLRMALAALASDSPHGRLWATILQHRFGGSGALAGHPIGNLMLAGLSEVLADPVAALDELGRILGVKGRVLPMCPIALQIEADVSGLEADPRMFRVIRGQVAIATTPGKVRRVRLLPDNRRRPGRPSTPSWPPTWWCSARLVVHQRHSARDGARAGGGATGDHRPPRAGAQPGGRAGGDGGLLRRASSARTRPARTGIHRARHHHRRRTGAQRAGTRAIAPHRHTAFGRGPLRRRGQTWYTFT